ncbi:MAG: TauD/TfdA family dioxygenase [Rhodospirillaceae bacterium]|nr:TauD/TfdA family dioxygenase [Rhodospirillaceae bacterium]
MTVEIVKLGEPLLAEIKGVDIAHPLDAESAAAVRQAFLDHCVLVFRDQTITAGQMVAFENVFGPPMPHITKKYTHPEFEELIVMTNLNERGEVDPFESDRGVGWHTDMCYLEQPAKATMLHTLEIPEVGGDTLFANMYRPLAEMPADLRRRIDGKRGTFRYGGKVAAERQARLEAKDQEAPLVDHPIIRRHSESGRESVYVNPTHTVGIAGMSEAEGDELLAEIYEWCDQERYQARHRWRMGDTVIWDNRCTWHSATGDNPKRQRRRFLRGTIADQPPRSG